MSARPLRRYLPAICLASLAALLCACGGQLAVTAPGTDAALQPVAVSGGDSPDRYSGLPPLKSIAASLPHVQLHRNRHGAEYEPLVSSPGECLTVGADLSLTISAGAGQVAFATYAIGGLSAGDVPEALTVVVADGGAPWIAVSDYARGGWEWHQPAATGGIQTVTLGDGGGYYSPDGVLYYALVVFDGGSSCVSECLLSTSLEEGTAVPGADYATYSATDAELRVWTDGPPSGVSISDGGQLSGYALSAELTGTAVQYEIALPDDGSLLAAQLACTPPGEPAMLLRVIESDPLDAVVIPQSADALGTIYADLDAGGIYLLFWLDQHGSSSIRNTSGLAALDDFDFARDSWPIGNNAQPPYSGFFLGNCWGMSFGSSWFSASGRHDAGLGSDGLYEHFESDPLWALGVASHLQAQQPWYWLARDYYSGLTGRERVDKLNLARATALAFGRGLPLYGLSGYPVIGEIGGSPVVSPLAVGHSVLYVGEQNGLAYFYDPNDGYDGVTNPYFKAVNPWSLPGETFRTPFASLTGNWSIQSVYDSGGGVRDSFDPANRGKYVDYQYPEVLITRSGEGEASQIRIESVDEYIAIEAASSFWDDFPEYSELNMQWISPGDGERFYTSERYCNFDSASMYVVEFADLLGLAESGGASIRSGTTVIPYYIRFQTEPDAEDHRHGATGYGKPDGVSIYYAGPDWEVLLPPQDVLASAGNPDHVAITWSAPTAGTVPTGYYIYRAASLEEEWSGPLNAEPWESTTYYDVPPQTDTDYWYAVASCTAAMPGQLISAVSYPDSGRQASAGGPPEITAVSPTGGESGAQVTFIPTISGATPDSYSWDFGGGATPNTSVAPTPTVTLGAPGIYQASLTVSGSSKSIDVFGFDLQVIPIGQSLVAIPDEFGYDVDFLRICYADPLVRRDDRLYIDPFGDVVPVDEVGYNDVLKINGAEFITAVVDFEVYPVVVIVEGDDPSEISGPDDDDAIEGIYVAEHRPGMLVVDVSVLTAGAAVGDVEHAYKVYSPSGASFGGGTFTVTTGLPTVAPPPVGTDWGINVWDREELEIGSQAYDDFTLDLATLASATPDVLWLEFADGWVFDFNDIGPYSNIVLVIDHASYGTLSKDIRLLTRTDSGLETYLGICTFTDADIYDAGAPEDPGILKVGESYSLSLDNPGQAGIDYEYATSLGVTSS